MGNCPKCGAKVETDWRFCMNCSAPVDPAPAPPHLPNPAGETTGQAPLPVNTVPAVTGYTAPVPVSTPGGGERFRVLRFVAKLLKVFAVIVAGAGLITFIGLSASHPGMANVGVMNGLLAAGMSFGSLMGGLLIGLCFWAAADFILVALAVEENTRAIRLGIE